jgi:hypothetical protein
VTLPRSRPGLDWASLCQLAHRLPGVEESTSYGTPALKVAGKLVARLWDDGETLVLKCDPDERDLLIEAAPQTFFLTDHYRGYPWILVRLSQAPPQTLERLFTQAWRSTAPLKLRKELGS